MSKIFRRSQIHLVLGRRVNGLELCRLGVSYFGSSGGFFPRDLDRMDMMFALVEQHPEFHITSQLHGAGNLLNRYVEGAKYYVLYRGNADPEIEFTQEVRRDDFTEEQIASAERSLQEFLTSPRTTVQIAAVNWILSQGRRKKAG